jgi:hypothetical protein
MGCFPCFDSKPKERKPLKKDDNNSSSRDGQSPAANPVAPISKLPSGKSLLLCASGRAVGGCIWHGAMLLGSCAQSVGIVAVGSVVLVAHP